MLDDDDMTDFEDADYQQLHDAYLETNEVPFPDWVNWLLLVVLVVLMGWAGGREG